MKLSLHTDYSLRVLMTLAILADRRVTIEELAARHQISKTHLMKVATTLIRLGLVDSVRGRGGGLRLAKPPQEINLGDVVRATETSMELVPCMGGEGCMFTGICLLAQAVHRALIAFVQELDRVTLADVVRNRPHLSQRLGFSAYLH
jgi:Rrf2 family transcriptional regulator, nitric oxide-sensitive transcriptional repressor